MGKVARIRSFLAGGLMLVMAVVLIAFPTEGYDAVCAILALMLILFGARHLIYYFTLAKYMVGGRRIFYLGILLLDVGIFAGSLTTVPNSYVMLYLSGGFAFTGLVNILRAREAKSFQAASWKWELGHGLFDIVIAVLCIVFLGSVRTAVYVYCLGLIHAALVRIANTFRRTAIVYIP